MFTILLKDVFKLESNRLTRLPLTSFTNEKALQTLIEKNLSTVFDGLEFLSTEFQIKNLKPDSVAFDTEKKSFVVIEYKNVKNKQVLDQGATYYRLLKEHKGDFVLLYSRIKNKPYDIDEFNWDEIYVIFLSPEFTKYQIGATGIGLPVKLYHIHQFGQGIITLERVGDVPTTHLEYDPTSTKPRSTNYIKLDSYDEEKYLNGTYKTGNSSPETRALYFKIKKRLLDKYEGLEFRQRKAYAGFYFKDNDACICTLDVSKSKIKITYSTIVKKNILSPSEFVRDTSKIGIFGVGHYQSEIKNEQDIEKAMPYVQTIYDYKTQT